MKTLEAYEHALTKHVNILIIIYRKFSSPQATTAQHVNDRERLFKRSPEEREVHLQSGHVAGLQGLLQSLAEQVVTDRGPGGHGGHAAAGVRLEERQASRCDSHTWGAVYSSSLTSQDSKG